MFRGPSPLWDSNDHFHDTLKKSHGEVRGLFRYNPDAVAYQSFLLTYDAAFEALSLTASLAAPKAL
jgi:hypothetical protein